MTDSSSRIDPWTLLRESNKASSNSLILTLHSPYNFISLILLSSVSGLSLRRNIIKHYSYRENNLTVNLTNVNLEQRSGVNFAEESFVIIKILKVLVKSISEFPTLLNPLPPVL